MEYPEYLFYRQSKIRCHCYGSGPELLLCLHGYGEGGESFAQLADFLGNRFTILAPDMPFHGDTHWSEGLLLSPETFRAILLPVWPAGQKITVAGYSMGGRIALSMMQQYPAEIKRLLLIAPDGLHHNKWQSIATATRPGNRLFAFTMQNPGWLLYLLQALAKTGLYSKNLLRFIRFYLDDPMQRKLLYQRWTTFRMFRPDQKKIASLLNQHESRIDLVFGAYDPVILTKYGRAFAEKNPDKISLKELMAGHQLLKEKYLPEICGLIS